MDKKTELNILMKQKQLEELQSITQAKNREGYLIDGIAQMTLHGETLATQQILW